MAVLDEPTTTEHQPYVPDNVRMPEFTWSAVLVGAALGIIFGASSLYLCLKVGMTVSASIPVAVLSITLFRGLSRMFGFRGATILENNIVQTTGSAGESIAFGVGVTMPALMLIGFEMDLGRIMVVSLLGGVLGILMMIPLRRAFIVQLHGRPGEPGKLLYPEGTACAQVLISGEKGGTRGLTVFVGFGLAFLHKFITEGMSLLVTTVRVPMTFYSKVAQLTGDFATELLGVGYIIGYRTSAIMFAGAVLGSLVLAPMIYLYGANLPLPLPPGKTSIGEMSLDEIHRDYIRFIGAGCVAAAGIISMARTLPMIVRSLTSGLRTLRGGVGGGAATRRTEDDLPLSFVLGGSLILLLVLSAILLPEMGFVAAVLGAMLVLLFGFLFVTVSSRLTGEIGSSSNPISGMTVATLLLTCLIFLGLGMTSKTDALLALTIGGVVCIAASNGGTTSQDLKTGFLVGGTPRLQQWAIIVGALTSAIVIGGTLLLFNQSGTVYSARNLPLVDVNRYADEMLGTEVYEGETYRVWRPSKEAVEAVNAEADKNNQPKNKLQDRGKYLVEEKAGRVRYLVDPAITGVVTTRQRYVPTELPGVKLKPEEVEKLTDTVTLGDSVYRVWTSSAAADAGDEEAASREYLVTDAGVVRYAVESTPVKMKFGAPKTQVMGIIINGLLSKDLNWTMILIGAMIAVTLELCGVSSLAFAVGVYVPMQYSTPIFLGGLIRSATESLMAPAAGGGAEAEVKALAKSESSPGVLLASGLIAGGSLAGVTIAFLEFDFLERIKKAVNFGEVIEKSSVAKDPYILPAVAVVVFGALCLLLLAAGMGKVFGSPAEEETLAQPPQA
jgi:putative OPT family oligopeptide transporter